MKLMTTQVAKWRKVKAPALFVDTSIKTGNAYLAPTWVLLTEYKGGLISPEEYEERFKNIIKMRWNSYSDFRQLVANMAYKEETQVLGCYCAAGEFCHRHLLVEFFQRYCEARDIPFEYLGELQ